MSGPMALAAHRGIKTQTRRPVKHQTECEPPLDACPFGRVGDRVYVRETFSLNRNIGPDEYARITYLADGAEHDTDGFRVCSTPNRINANPERQRWTPSIHMPKWAARTWGTITDVRVERVQDISAADAIAEGIERHDSDGVTYYGEFENGHRDPRVEFNRLWGSLYSGALNWYANPWVWVVTLERDK